MANNDHKNSDFVKKRAIPTGIFLVVGVLIYLFAKDILFPSNTREISVGFRVSGRITQMFFAEHTKVKKGDILASLDKAPFEEAVTSAKAQLQLAQAEYDKSTHLPDNTFRAIETARTSVETAQHAYDAAHAELEDRKKRLVPGQLDNVYNDDVQEEHDAQLNLEKANRELTQLEDAPNANRDAARAAVQSAEAKLTIAETNLTDAQLLAPSDGTVVRRVSDIGATVQAGSTVYVLSVPYSDNK